MSYKKKEEKEGKINIYELITAFPVLTIKAQ